MQNEFNQVKQWHMVSVSNYVSFVIILCWNIIEWSCLGEKMCANQVFTNIILKVKTLYENVLNINEFSAIHPNDLYILFLEKDRNYMYIFP